MPTILATIFEYVWKRPWILALAALLLLSGGLYWRLHSVSDKLDRVRGEVELLSRRIEEQNRAVETWKAAAASQEAKAKASEEEAVRIRKISESRLFRLLSEPVPAACNEAITWAATAGARLGKEWEESP